MRYSFPRLFAAFFVTIIMLCLFIGCLSSCTTTKEMSKQTEVIDSSYTKELERRLYESEITIHNYEQRIEELENLTVEFDNKCDTVINNVIEQIIQSGCPPARIDSFLNVIKSFRNKVKVLADGSKEFEGYIKNVKLSKEKLEQVTAVLRSEKTKLLHKLEAVKAELKTLKESKEKKSKTKFLNQWWLLPTGIVIGFYLCLKRKRILAFLRPVKSKL